MLIYFHYYKSLRSSLSPFLSLFLSLPNRKKKPVGSKIDNVQEKYKLGWWDPEPMNDDLLILVFLLAHPSHFVWFISQFGTCLWLWDFQSPQPALHW